MATRRSGQLEALALSALSGVVALLALAWIAREGLPPPRSLVWAAFAGLSVSVGLASLYKGLALGSAAVVAPTAGVITAALPVIFSGFTEGLPRTSQLLGFFAAMAGIWLVARARNHSPGSHTGLRLAFLAGAGFGGFLILIAQVDSGLVFAPLAVARTAMLATALALMVVRRVHFPAPAAHPVALLAGVLDAGGNVFYMFARQHVRLDVAAVLSSLYPVATVVLAHIISHEPVSRAQWVGAGVCLVAVALITM